MSMPRELQSAGLSIFIKKYELFKSNLPTSQLIERLVKERISNENGAKARISSAKKNLQNPAIHQTCLEYIALHSTKATIKERELALKFLKQL